MLVSSQHVEQMDGFKMIIFRERTGAAFVVSLQMDSEKRRYLRIRNVMRSMRCAVQNKGITLKILARFFRISCSSLLSL